MSEIRDYISGFYDGPHATPKESVEGPIFLGIKNVAPDGRLDFSEIRHVSDDEFPRWTKRVLPQKDDIVFSYEATLHRYAIIPEGFHGCLGRRMALMRPDITKVNPRFLHYYLLSPLWKAQADASVIVGATVNRIPLTKVPQFKVHFPDLPTQDRIASVLSAYDDLIENNRRRIALLEEATRLLYREWFVHFRFPGHEHVKAMNSMEEFSLGQVCALRGGNAFKTKHQGNLKGEIPFIKVGDMNSPGNTVFITESNNWVSEIAAKEMKAFALPAGTIVFAKIGEALKQNRIRILSEPTIIDNNMMGAIFNDEYISTELLYCMLSSYDIASHASGAAVPFLTAKVLSEIRFTLVSPEIRTAFTQIVNPMCKQIKALQSQLSALMRARDLLLPRLMDGRLEI